jgi:hypothetical protein
MGDGRDQVREACLVRGVRCKGRRAADISSGAWHIAPSVTSLGVVKRSRQCSDAGRPPNR